MAFTYEERCLWNNSDSHQLKSIGTVAEHTEIKSWYAKNPQCFPLTSKICVRRRSKLILYVLLKFSIIQARDMLRPWGSTAECVHSHSEAGENSSTSIQMYMMEASAWVTRKAQRLSYVENQKPNPALAECSNGFPTYGLIWHSVHKATNYSSKPAKCLDFFS